MNTDPLHTLWTSEANLPDPAAGRRLADQFVARLRRRRRFQGWWLAWTLFALSAVTLLALRQVLLRGAAEIVAHWALLPMLGLPWLAALYFLQTYRREGRATAGAALPLRAALVAAQASNHAERRRLALVGGLLAAMLPLSALAVWQLHAAGKAPGNQAWSLAAGLAAALTAGAVVVAGRYYWQLRPERRTVDLLLRELETSDRP